MLFERRLQEGLKDGSVRLAFRRWQRPQAVSGHRYRSPIGFVDVEDISVVSGLIPAADAQAAGYPSTDALMADLKGPSDAAIYRLTLRRVEVADPRDQLANSADLSERELAQLTLRLARLDQRKPWTAATLRAIAQAPGVRASDLFEPLGWPDLLTFKLHVRKLKALGLTLSLRIGYQLSPRGEAYLRALEGGPMEPGIR